MPTTSIGKIPVIAQAITQRSSPQSNASVRYPVGGIFIELSIPLSVALEGTASKMNVPETIR